MGAKLGKRHLAVIESLSSGYTFREAAMRLKLSDQEIARSWTEVTERVQSHVPESLDDYRLLATCERIERQRLEAELWASEARLNALMDTAPDAVFLIEGRSGRILKANNRALQLFGYTPRELLNSPMEMLLESDVKAKHVGLRRGFLSSVRKREMGYHPPIHALTKEGRRLKLDIALTATASTDDVMVVCSVFDGQTELAANPAAKKGKV